MVNFFLFRRLDSLVERLDLKLDRSVEQLRSDNKELDAKLNRSVEQLDAKLERLGSQLYNLNGKVNRLLGHTFGVSSLIEEDEEDMKVNS